MILFVVLDSNGDKLVVFVLVTFLCSVVVVVIVVVVVVTFLCSVVVVVIVVVVVVLS